MIIFAAVTTSTNMKKIFLLALVFTQALCSCHENLEERAMRECQEETRKNCPRVMSPEMVMDSLAFDKASRTMQCFATVSGSLDTLDMDRKKWLEENLLEGIINETSNKGYKDAGFNFQYTFYSKKTARVLYSFTYSQKDYYPDTAQ